MNCDQAFDAMTDPDRPDHRKLSRHLDSCPRCRQMFETLEPALGLFAAVDSEPTERSAAIPTRLASSSVRMAQQIAGRLLPAAHSSRRNPQGRRLWGAVFAAAVAGFLLSVGLRSTPPPTPVVPPGTATDCAWLNRSTVSDDEPARVVAITCVSCHLARPSVQQRSVQQRSVQQPDETALIDVSQELERLVTRWRAMAKLAGDGQMAAIQNARHGTDLA